MRLFQTRSATKQWGQRENFVFVVGDSKLRDLLQAEPFFHVDLADISEIATICQLRAADCLVVADNPFLTASVLKQAQSNQIPVILVGDRDRFQLAEAFRCGACDYVFESTLSRVELLKAVQRVLTSSPHAIKLRSDERLSYVVRLNDLLSPISDPIEIQIAASSFLGDQLCANRVLFAEINGDTAVVHRDYVNGVSSIAGKFFVHDFGEEVIAAYLRGDSVVINDVASDPLLSANARAAFRSIQVAADLSMGLLKDGKWVAAIAIHHASPRVWTALDMALMEETAERTWEAVQRGRAEAALRESELCQALLVRLGDALRPLTSTCEIQQTACGLLSEHLHVDRAVYGDIYQEGEGRAVIAQCASLPSVSGSGRTMYLTGDVDQEAEISPEAKALYRKLGIRACIAAPLMRGEKLEGVVALQQRTPRVWTANEITLLHEVAERTWATVERVRAEDEVRIARERLQVSVDSCEIGIGFTNLLTGESTANAVMSKQIGHDPDVPLTPERYLKHVHPADLRLVRKSWENATKFGQRIDIEFRVIDSAGSVRWIKGIGRVSPQAQGRPRYVYSVTLDITEQKRVEETLRAANEDLNRFAYAAAHDLREPLRNIAIGTQIITRQATGETQQFSPERLQQLQLAVTEGVQRMDRLLEDLLEYSQAGESGPEPPLQLDLNAALRKIVANLYPAVETTGAQISYSGLPTLTVHESEIISLFQNLLGNALKYRGAEIPHIVISASKRAGEWLFCVRDNGEGIDPEFARHIFGMFKRLHGRDIPGTGIGLAICEKIVTKRGGRIWVESELGKGSSFFFTWPVAR